MSEFVAKARKASLENPATLASTRAQQGACAAAGSTNLIANISTINYVDDPVNNKKLELWSPAHASVCSVGFSVVLFRVSVLAGACAARSSTSFGAWGGTWNGRHACHVRLIHREARMYMPHNVCSVLN